MKQLIFSVALFFVCLSTAFAQQINKSEYFIFPLNDYVRKYFPPNCTRTDLTKQEIGKAEQLLEKCIKAYNIERGIDNDLLRKKERAYIFKYYIIYPKEYTRQYIPAINRQGEKLIWIRCFCNYIKGRDLTKDFVSVDDGGKCIFSLWVNLGKNDYYDLRVNGY